MSSNQKIPQSKLRFIHIGKCGGTYVHHAIGMPSQFHARKPLFDKNHLYIIWVRNPIARFVSAFNMSYALVNYDTTDLVPSELTLENCLAPGRVRKKMSSECTFSTKYDQLIRQFKTANELAESLTSSNETVRRSARELMNDRAEHIRKGIGWYLNSSKLIPNHNEQILFVGSVENMEADLERLCKVLGRARDEAPKRENSFDLDRSLSPIAVQNVKHFYSGDYRALRWLNRHGWISDQLLAEYQQYSLMREHSNSS